MGNIKVKQHRLQAKRALGVADLDRGTHSLLQLGLMRAQFGDGQLTIAIVIHCQAGKGIAGQGQHHVGTVLRNVQRCPLHGHKMGLRRWQGANADEQQCASQGCYAFSLLPRPGLGVQLSLPLMQRCK